MSTHDIVAILFTYSWGGYCLRFADGTSPGPYSGAT